MPFAKIQNMDLAVTFIHYKNDYSVKTCLVFDLLLFGDQRLEDDIDLGLKFNRLIVRFDNYDVINFYTIYFTFFKQTIKYLDESNNHIIIRDNLPILQQFTEQIFDIVIDDDNLDGFYDSEKQTMLLNFTAINQIPLTINTRIKLTYQDRFEENGIYFVKYHTSDGKTIIQKYLIYKGRNKLVENMHNMIDITNYKNQNIEGIAFSDIKEDDLIYVENRDQYANLVKLNNKYYLKLQDKIIEDPTNDPRYDCYDDQQVKSRGLCESDYDMLGKPKYKKQYWDRRCEINTDCDFYQANKNYLNYHGGCQDGYCELPLGMKAVSYRKYDPNILPMCYNCKNPDDVFCCEDQKDRNKYPDLTSPDYVFHLDQFERLKGINENKREHIKFFN